MAALLRVLEVYPLATYDILHIQYRSTTDVLWLPQLNAVNSMVTLLRQRYPQTTFHLLSPVLEIPCEWRVRTQDVIFYQFFSALFGTRDTGVYTYVVNGTTKSDCVRFGVDWPEFGNDFIRPTGRTVGKEIFEGIKAFMGNTKLTMWRPVTMVEKHTLWHRVPEDFKNLCWSCHTPIINFITGDCKACGTCRACQEYAAEGILKHNDVNVSAVLPIYNNLTQL